MSGASGAQGDQGDIGPTGPVGPTGPTGPQGLSGASGAQGDQGADGGFTGLIPLNLSWQRPIGTDNVQILRTHTNITIQHAETSIYQYLSSNTGYVDWQVEFGPGRRDKGTEVFSSTQRTDGSDFYQHTTPATPQVGPDQFLFWSVTGISGAPDQFDMTLYYSID